jgi:hypothetical protein
VGYRAFALSANTTLSWPSIAQNLPDVVADLMEVTPSGPGFSITMPDARQVGIGTGTIIRNVGGSSFNVLDAAGGTIATVASGTARYLYITSQSTAAGVWGSVTLGASTSVADAASLVGAGLRAIGASLNQSMPADPSASASVSVNSADRARVKIATGGSATYNLANTSVVGVDWFCGFVNAGSGMMTLDCDGLETIDGQGSIQLAPGESALVICGNSGLYYTLGRGRSTAFNFTQLVKSLAPGGTAVLTNSESANKLMRFVGLLTSNAIVEFPSTVGVYYLYNNTTGAFTTNIKTAAGSPYALPQGQRAIVYCDGVDILPAQTSIPSGGVLFADGTQSAPGMSYATETGLGFYRVSAATLAAAALSADTLRLIGVASAVRNVVVGNAISADNAYVGTNTGNLAIRVAGSETTYFTPTGFTNRADNNQYALVASRYSLAVGGALIDTDSLSTFLGMQINGVRSGTFRATEFGVSGNLRFDAVAGARVLGDFSNATLASRVMFQTSTSNSSTSVSAIPNGSSDAAAFSVFNNSTSTNAGVGVLAVTGSETSLQSSITGSGTPVPLTFYTHSGVALTQRMSIGTNGNVTMGTAAPIAGARSFSISNTNADPAATAQFAAVSQAGTFLWQAGSNANPYAFISCSSTFTSGLVINAEGAVPIVIQNNSAERLRISGTGGFNAWTVDRMTPAYFCRTWVNFNGVTPGSAPFRANGNVGSITKNGTGDYTLNFGIGMPDGNYAALVTSQTSVTASALTRFVSATASNYRFLTTDSSGNVADIDYIMVGIFR